MSVIYLQEPASGKLEMTNAGVDRTEVPPFLFALSLSTLIASAIETDKRQVVIIS